MLKDAHVAFLYTKAIHSGALTKTHCVYISLFFVSTCATQQLESAFSLVCLSSYRRPFEIKLSKIEQTLN